MAQSAGTWKPGHDLERRLCFGGVPGRSILCLTGRSNDRYARLRGGVVVIPVRCNVASGVLESLSGGTVPGLKLALATDSFEFESSISLYSRYPYV